MEGVILYADDDIFDNQNFVNQLFQRFNSEGTFSIIPINSLTVLERTVSSISTYNALILDWNFKRPTEVGDDELGIAVSYDNPYDFLKSNNIYSLVYVYSQENIAPEIKAELESIYPNKIFFETKSANNLDTEFNKITQGITTFQQNNNHLKTPYIWSQAINKSAQKIFSELEAADPNWIKEIYTSSQTDGGEPNAEVIGVFQNLLAESIIQDSKLITAITEASQLKDVEVKEKEKSLAKLYNRIYYTKLIQNAPIMTGDIFKFSEDEYAILITPECDINSKKDNILEFLKFKISESKAFISKKKKDSGIFNNGVQSRHILPSFPFIDNDFSTSAFIDFETAFIVKEKKDFENSRYSFKLNSPYIFQLRQRYLAYIGRVGVPAIPTSLRNFNLQ